MKIRKALLVGINAYPGKPLRGCVNDVLQVKSLLGRFYGFAEEGVHVLIDNDATLESIRAGLEWLAQGGTEAESVRIFHYSGHGSYVADMNGDEPDGRDECLVPVDYQTAGMLTDDALKILYDRFPRNQNLTLVMDSCFSGSVQKDAEEQIIGRFLPVSWEEQERIDETAARVGEERRDFVVQEIKKMRGVDLEEDELERRAHGLMERFEKKRFGDIRVREANILLSGCRADQQSADAHFAGEFHGAFTYHLAQVITQSNGQITYHDLARQVGKKLYAAGFIQIPQLECRASFASKMAFKTF